MAIITVDMKHNDMCYLEYDGPNEYGTPEVVVSENDYMPSVNKVFTGGDQTGFRIDNDTGQILNWTPIKIEDGKFVEVK